jgi:hypothetical protein
VRKATESKLTKPRLRFVHGGRRGKKTVAEDFRATAPMANIDDGIWGLYAVSLLFQRPVASQKAQVTQSEQPEEIAKRVEKNASLKALSF